MAIEMNWQISRGNTSVVSQLSCMVPIFNEQGEKVWNRIGDVMAFTDGAHDL